jgi:single-stranded DNA-binding protein
MSIDALISGKLHGQPQQRTSKNGNSFTTAKVRVPTGDESTFCNVIAFSETAQAALLALDSGEAVALAGSLKVGIWQANDGTHKPSLDLTASQVLTTYSIAKKRKASQPDQDDRQHDQRPTDAWKAAAPAPRQQRGHAPADDLDNDLSDVF